jgi:putative membrane protein
MMRQEDKNLGKGAAIFIALQTLGTFLTLSLMPLFVDMEALVSSPTPTILEYLIVIGMALNLAFVLWHSCLTKGVWRSILAASVTIFLAWYAEYLGVTYGLVFGWYHYTHLFEPQIYGVPVLICIAWEPILYSSYLMADFLLPSDLSKEKSFSKKLIPIIMLSLCGCIIVTVWDLMADPVAVNRGYWAWHDGGPYVRDLLGGVPMSNFIGWLELSFVCHLFYRLILETGPKKRHSIYLSVYGPILQYLNLFIFFALQIVTMLKRMDVLLIGSLSMGGMVLLGISKLYLKRFSAAEESWTSVETDTVRAGGRTTQ